MALLAQKFEPFADELALESTFDLMQFARRAAEKIVESLTRFEQVRLQAQNLGGVEISVQGAFYILLKAVGVIREQQQQLFAPLQGQLP
eukprot:10891029-Lingulodinium_polyedra.AAC.1